MFVFPKNNQLCFTLNEALRIYVAIGIGTYTTIIKMRTFKYVQIMVHEHLYITYYAH